MKLNEIAVVRTGLVLSRKEAKDTSEKYEYHQLNLKAVSENGIIKTNELIPYYASEELSENYLTQAGDIIVKTSEPYTAVLITDEYVGIVVPSHFVIVRVDDTKAIPKYVEWYLNKERIKKSFNMSCVGLLKQIKPTTIAETEIKLPDLEKQRQVASIYELSKQELKLIEQLKEQKQVYYKSLINKINRM